MNEIKPYAVLRGADLRGTHLQEADLRGADLRGADLRWADLWGAHLQEADLRGAHLQEADLRRADLRGANLRKANLQKACMRWANLQDADLRETGAIAAQLGPYWVVATPDGAWCGCEWQPGDEWLKMTDAEMEDIESGASEARAIYGDVLRAMLKTAAAIGWPKKEGVDNE